MIAIRLTAEVFARPKKITVQKTFNLSGVFKYCLAYGHFFNATLNVELVRLAITTKGSARKHPKITP